MATKKTPDVYEEHNSRFPPAVTEFRRYFGGGKPLTPTVMLVDDNAVSKVNESVLPAADCAVQTELEALNADSLQELFSTFIQTGQFPWWIARELTNQLDPLYRRFWQIAPV